MDVLHSKTESRSTPDEHFLIRPEEAVGLFFFFVLLVMSITHDSPLFEPVRESRLTYFTAILLVVSLVGLTAWQSWLWFTRWRMAKAPSVSGNPKRLSPLRLLRDWMPAVLSLGIYESLKHLHLNEIVLWLGITPKDHWMIAFDETVFGGHASVALESIISPAMTWYMKKVYYIGYYVYPALVGLVLYAFKPRRAFRELVLAFLSAAFIGYIFYILIPVAGPRFSEVAHLYTVPLTASGKLEVMQMDTLRYQYDCFPSLHTAIPLTVLIVALRNSRRLGLLLAPFVLSTVLSTLYLRMHYMADVLAGMTLAPVCVYIGIHADGWWLRLQQAFHRAIHGKKAEAMRKQTMVHAGLAAVAVLWLIYLVK